MLPPTLNVAYNTPYVNSPFIANCTAGFSPGVPDTAIRLAWLENNSPQFDTTTIFRLNATHTTIQSVLSSVQLNDILQYTCQAGVVGDYVYTQPGSNRPINARPIRKFPCQTLSCMDNYYNNYSLSSYPNIGCTSGRPDSSHKQQCSTFQW